MAASPTNAAHCSRPTRSIGPLPAAFESRTYTASIAAATSTQLPPSGALAPSLARTYIGAGWNAYNALVGVGDLNGDGHADLLARDPAGYLWRYNGDAKGAFAARVKTGSGRQTYKSLF